MSRIEEIRCNQSATNGLAAFLQGMVPRGTVGDVVNVVWSILDGRSPRCFFSCQSHEQWGYERQRLADIHLSCHPVHTAAECISSGRCFWWALTWNTKIQTSRAHAHRFTPLVSNLPTLHFPGPWPPSQTTHHTSGIHTPTYFRPLLSKYKLYMDKNCYARGKKLYLVKMSLWGWMYLWRRNGDADVEKEFVDTVGEEAGRMSGKSTIGIYTL